VSDTNNASSTSTGELTVSTEVTTGQLIDNKTIDAAKELDQRIRNCLKDYVQLGKLLMEMRDNQAYRLVGPYSTFEDYCKDVEGLAYTVAQEKIRHYLVQSAIEAHLPPEISGPMTETQVRQLCGHDGAIARFMVQKRTVTTRSGEKRQVKVPVSIANPKDIADQWQKIVKAHEEAVVRSEERHRERVQAAKEAGQPEPVYRRPKLTGAFVVNQLPYHHQPPRATSGKAHHFVRWTHKVMKGVDCMEDLLDGEPDKWSKLVATPHRERLSPHVVEFMRGNIAEAIEILKRFDQAIEKEFCQ
jgi:hypothetical protein